MAAYQPIFETHYPILEYFLCGYIVQYIAKWSLTISKCTLNQLIIANTSHYFCQTINKNIDIDKQTKL